MIFVLSRLVDGMEYRSGYDNNDFNAATENSVVVCNVPDFATAESTDHTVALILGLAGSWLQFFHLGVRAWLCQGSVCPGQVSRIP